MKQGNGREALCISCKKCFAVFFKGLPCGVLPMACFKTQTQHNLVMGL
jgi:hypothetical protein